ncbi:MAG: metallophosphoesterase family protein [Candidatus Omnitrophica bacterium]|nr:metallophosphoesterase family protein [Candidatus Omnitrophota bacterium]
MKIGVISDTHIANKAEHIPRIILDVFKQMDMVMHAGDMVDLKVVDELRSACPKVVAVAGNMDHDAVKKKYPVKQIIEVSGHKIGLMHGHGAPLNLVGLLKDSFKDDKPDVVVFGHSHKPMNEFIEGVLFFNPGSATDFTAEYNSYGIIEINGGVNARVIKI